MAWACAEEPPRPVRQPNVVLVVCDTLRADRTTLYGHERDTTPNLAALAATGTVFENAFAMSSWTLPSMSMLLTGELKGLADPSILTSHFHVAESFAAAGYDTGAIVANPVLNETLHYQRGLDHFEVERTNVMQMRADEVVGKGLRWLDGRETQESPFFLWLHPVDPHHGYEPTGGPAFPPLPEAKALANARLSLDRSRSLDPSSYPSAPLTDEDWAHICAERTLYDSEVLQFDAAMGALIEALKERGLFENTVIVVTSDHGEGLWDRPRNPHDAEADAFFPALYRRHGLMLHSEQTHVPLLLHGPGVPKGERRAGFVPHIDVVPTLHALCNVPLQKLLPGHALIGEGSDAPRGPLFAVCSRSHSVTVEERWRLHQPRPNRVRKWGIEPELYDLSVDPHERRPVDDPAKIEAYAAMIEAWSEQHSPVQSMQEITREQLERLDALGYGGEIEVGNLPLPKRKDG